MWYYIRSYPSAYYFLNLCGHFSLTEERSIASRWDEKGHKAMWYFLHELRASTNQEWVVVDIYGEIVKEPKEARTFIITKINTIENVEFEVTLEEKTFNEEFNDNKPIPSDIFYSELRINGEIKFLPIAKVNGKFYRYKHCLSSKDMTERMWRW